MDQEQIVAALLAAARGAVVAQYGDRAEVLWPMVEPAAREVAGELAGELARESVREPEPSPAPLAPPKSSPPNRAIVTWTKLRDGSFGLRSTKALRKGEEVTVQRKDGTTNTASAGNLVWKGDGAFIYTIGRIGVGGVIASVPARRGWRPCGYPGCRPGYCDECDGRGR